MRKHILSLSLCWVVGLFVITLANAGEKEPETEEIHAGNIALNLSIKYSGMNMRFLRAAETGEIPPYFAPMVVIWEDGRILFGEYDKKKDDWTYEWGKIDLKTVASLQKNISDSYRLGKKNVHSWNFGPDATTHFLRTKFSGGFFIVDTWEQFDNAKHEPKRVVITAKNTKNRRPVYLPEYYDTWKEVKKAVLEAGKKAVSDNAIPVDVVIEHYVLTVKDKDGNILLRQDFSDNFHPENELEKKAVSEN